MLFSTNCETLANTSRTITVLRAVGKKVLKPNNASYSSFIAKRGLSRSQVVLRSTNKRFCAASSTAAHCAEKQQAAKALAALTSYEVPNDGRPERIHDVQHGGLENRQKVSDVCA